MTPAEISQYLGLALAVIALLGHAKGYFSSGEKNLTSRTEQVEGKLVEHDRRIQRIEDELKHLPSKDQVNDIKLAMSDLKGTVAVLGESMASVSRTVHRLEDYLKERERA
ncbi:DUF2730 family protein [Mycoplana ramosa]|uniref:DUF2730 family protein n=1 Tax=Mycoplana ramosa TaxID=40837 RepID=A0ABW3Z236_MYCRA